MSLTRLKSDCPVVFLYTEIGRGHPSYLDGIVTEMRGLYPQIKIETKNVFELTHGVSHLCWKLIRVLYRLGSQGGLVTKIYNQLRKLLGGHSHSRFSAKLLGRDIVRYFTDYRGVIVVAHPLLAKLLENKHTVIYQHGEFAVPEEALVSHCRYILVPDAETADTFRQKGTDSRIIKITGQCIDSLLVTQAKPAYDARMERFRRKEKGVVALFSSGAVPKIHVGKLLSSANALLRQGYQIYIFVGSSEHFFRKTRVFCEKNKISYSLSPLSLAPATIIYTKRRREENDIFASIFSSVDFFIAPAHERVHWAVGLGLPQFMLCPHIGTFAPQNAKLVLARSVGREIISEQDAENFGNAIEGMLNDGTLERMAKFGFLPENGNGFRNCARIIREIIY